MFFSIVTATFNAARSIERNIRSVIAQSHFDLEHLVIDNCSTDDTREIIRACNSPFVEMVSETDNGIYDAFNKGVARARGDVIAFLNADDYYLDGTLAAVREFFAQHPEAAIVHGNARVEKDGKPFTVRAPQGIFSYGGARVLHPAFFCRRAVFEALGPFDTKYKVLADLDFMFRAHQRFAFHHLDRCLTHFALGGISTQRRFSVANEVRAIARSHGYGVAHTSWVWLIECGTKFAGLIKKTVVNERPAS